MVCHGPDVGGKAMTPVTYKGLTVTVKRGRYQARFSADSAPSIAGSLVASAPTLEGIAGCIARFYYGDAGAVLEALRAGGAT
jgi:hypothetical protein